MDKYDIFISYSRKDKARVDEIIGILINRGYSVWIDVNGIESGEAFRRNIVDAIENSSIVIFFSSQSSNISKWTTKEISLAVEFAKYIIPIKLDNTRYNKSILFDLIDLDYIDMSESRLFEASSHKLLRTVSSKLGKKKSEEVRDENNQEKVTDEDSSFEKSKRVPVNFNLKNIRESMEKCSASRSGVVDAFLVFLLLFVLLGLFLGVAFWPAALLGLFGVLLLSLNKEDGLPFIAASAFLWTLAEAYGTATTEQVYRFFRNGNPLIVWLPLGIAILSPMAMYIRKGGVEWWRRCKKLSIGGIVLLTITTVFWIWSIYFDFVTKFGLPPNIRHYVNKLFN